MPTLELPMDVPAGTDGIVADFISFCSLAMTDQPAAIEKLSDHNWPEPGASELAQMAAMGGYTSENADGYIIQLMPIEFPHVQGQTCMIFGTQIDEMPDFAPLDQIAGLDGGIQTTGFGDFGGKIGRYSGIAPSGYPLTVQLTNTGDRFFNLSMTTTRPVKPSRANQE